MSFTELLQRTQEKSLESEKYHYYSLAKIQSNSLLKQGLFDHIMVFENYPISEKLNVNTKKRLDFKVRSVHVFEQTNYDFVISIFPGKSLFLKFDYNMSNLNFEVYDHIDNINKNQWNNLVEQSSLGSFFHRHEWIKSIEDGMELIAKHLIILKNDNLVGIFPNFITRIVNIWIYLSNDYNSSAIKKARKNF